MDSLLIQLGAYDTEAAPLDWLPAGSQVGEVQHLVARALERLEQVEAQPGAGPRGAVPTTCQVRRAHLQHSAG